MLRFCARYTCNLSRWGAHKYSIAKVREVLLPLMHTARSRKITCFAQDITAWASAVITLNPDVWALTAIHSDEQLVDWVNEVASSSHLKGSPTPKYISARYNEDLLVFEGVREARRHRSFVRVLLLARLHFLQSTSETILPPTGVPLMLPSLPHNATIGFSPRCRTVASSLLPV